MTWAHWLGDYRRVIRAIESAGNTDHEVAASYGVGDATVDRTRPERRRIVAPLMPYAATLPKCSPLGFTS
jgi:hypothetical protein